MGLPLRSAWVSLRLGAPSRFMPKLSNLPSGAGIRKNSADYTGFLIIPPTKGKVKACASCGVLFAWEGSFDIDGKGGGLACDEKDRGRRVGGGGRGLRPARCRRRPRAGPGATPRERGPGGVPPDGGVNTASSSRQGSAGPFSPPHPNRRTGLATSRTCE